MPWGDGLPDFGDFPAGAWGDGLPLGPAEAAPGAAPQVVSAISPSCKIVNVTYDSEVNHVAAGNANDSLNPANYTIAGDGAQNVASVALVQASPTTVQLTLVSGLINGNNYTVTVANVENAAATVIDPAHDSATFTGARCLAQNFVAEVLIGTSVVWSAVNSFPQSSITIDVSNITGKHTLKFRIRGTD